VAANPQRAAATDAELARRVTRGDRDAEAELFVRLVHTPSGR
jgi:hypothetical protein